jgi:hypothetical protein
MPDEPRSRTVLHSRATTEQANAALRHRLALDTVKGYENRLHFIFNVAFDFIQFPEVGKAMHYQICFCDMLMLADGLCIYSDVLALMLDR